jgi:hypothetical protein
MESEIREDVAVRAGAVDDRKLTVVRPASDVGHRPRQTGPGFMCPRRQP